MTSSSTRVAMILAVLVVATGVVACSSTIEDGTGPDRSAAPTSTAPKRLASPDVDTFDVDGGTATLACQGSGPVPVILVAGPDDPVSRWDTLVDDIGQEVLVCRFAAPPEPTPATPTSVADALSQTLDASGLPGPYVVVAHALGGFSVRRFGERHPDKLRGALFLDPSAPTALPDSLTAAGWDPTATRAEVDAPAPWPDVPVSILTHAPTGEPAGADPSGTDATRAFYTALVANARFEVVDGAERDVDLDRTRRATYEIDRLIEGVN